MASLDAQTFTDFEIIAVDDGSTDGTPDILARAASASPRLRVIRRAPLGVVSAANHAAELAGGNLLARMDADDIAYPERLARQVALLDSNPDLVACGTQIRYIPRETLKDGFRRYEHWINNVITPEDIARELFVECPIPNPTLMVRRSTFHAVGGYRDGDFPEDYDLILRLSSPISRLSKVPEVLLDWRDSPTRLTRTDSRYSAGSFRRLKVSFLPSLRFSNSPVVVWGAGPLGKAFALELQTQGVTVAAFVDLDPRKIGQTIHGAPVIAPDYIEEYRGLYILAAVGQAGAREEIRAVLERAGCLEVKDWCAVA